MLYHFGIGPDIVDYIIDDSPLKQGLLSPGMHIPVISSDILDSDPPDVLIVLAWNFADVIVENNRSFCDGGGQFLIPLPTVRVVS